MKGLTSDEAKKLLEEHGKNELEEENQTTALTVFLRQFSNLMIWILIGAGIISFIAGKTLTFYFIAVIVGIISLMGFLQEWKAEKAMEELEEMTEPYVQVYRDGTVTEVPSSEIVPGDVVKFEMGDKIPADCEATEINNVEVDEAVLTGESEAVDKDKGDTLFSGTTIVHGRCEAKVTETGMDTELGKIADEIQQEEDKTPLQNKVDDLGKQLAVVALVVCTIIFTTGVYEGAPVVEILVVTLALTVATVPEALPLTLTLTLSLGMREMAQKNAIVKKMLAVEGLGSTTVICTDKTGTLTKNEMTVTELYFDDMDMEVTGSGYKPKGEIQHNGNKIEKQNYPTLKKLLTTSVLCNNAEKILEDGKHSIRGDPTEGSLVVLGRKEGLEKKELEKKHPRKEEILFTSERKMMTTINETDNENTAYSKGAPEVILDKCSKIMINGKEKPLTDQKKQKILDQNQKYAKDALRILGLAYRPNIERPFNEDNIEKDMVFLGLTGMIDPARPEIKEALETCEKAGINVKMVTGDNPITAKAIAKDIGLADNPELLTGPEIEKMSEEELERKVPDVDIYARTHPEHKLHIVNALKEDGEIVAMTGDGVNDAPAIKKADIGIGMGEKGTDVTKESADMILQDDNFGTIVEAIEDGRRIYDNIEKFTTYLLSRNFTEILIILLGIVFLGFEYLPLIAIQILFINVIGEEMPSISLGLDPATEGIMERPPRDPEREILNPRNLFLVVSMAGFMSVVGFIVFQLGSPLASLEKARTMAFATIVLMVMVHSYNFRSLTNSILEIDLLKNKWMTFSTILVGLMLYATVQLPQGAQIFSHTPLNTEEWLIALGGAIGTLVFIEAIKYIGKTHLPD